MKGRLFLGLTLLLVLSLSVSGYALSDVSFRMLGLGRGLAGLVTDEYTDFNLFPALVVDMTETTLFTNLGNLGKPVRTLDQDRSDDKTSAMYDYGENAATNAVGLITDLSGGKAGFLYEDGSYDRVFEHSENHEDYQGGYPEDAVVYSWSPYGRVYSEAWTEKEAARRSDLSVFYGTTLDSGVKLAGRVGQVQRDVSSSYDYQESSREQYNYDDHTYTYQDLDMWQNETNLSRTRLEAGAAFAAGEWTVDAAAKYAPEQKKVTRVGDCSYDSKDVWQDEDGDDIDEYFTENGGDRSRTRDLSTVTLRGRASRPVTLFGAEAVGRLSAEFSSGNGSFEGAIKSTEKTFSDYSEPDYIDRTTTVTTRERKVTGDQNLTAYNLGGGYQVALGERTLLGLGLRLAGGNSKTVVKKSGEEEVDTETVESGDPDNLESTTETHKILHNDPKETTRERETFSLSLPVGIEHRLTDRLTLRLGSEAFLVNRAKTTTTRKTTDAADVVDGETGEEDTEESMASDSAEYADTYAVYSAGFGYQLSENVQLDAVHVTNLVDLRDWLVSATIKF